MDVKEVPEMLVVLALFAVLGSLLGALGLVAFAPVCGHVRRRAGSARHRRCQAGAGW